MSRELFKKTFFPLGIDEPTVYKWFVNKNRHLRVFKDGSENISSLDMVHIATTRGKDELWYFNEIADHDPCLFSFTDVIFYDDNFKFAWDSYVPTTATDNDGDIVYEEETVERKFKSGLVVSYNTPDDYCGPMNKYEEHLYTMLDIHELYYTKNKDYGDAFTQSLDKHGPIAALVRMEDKWNRLSNLMSTGKEGYIKSESVEDTLIDLANYAIMTALYLRGKDTDD